MSKFVDLPIWFYNLRVGRSHVQVEVELRAIASLQPAVIGLCEAIGYDLPTIKGYQLVRDRSTVSRSNIAAYVRDDLKVSRVRWRDLKETWHRTEHPGQHEPRSFLVLRVAGVQVIVHHQPPKGTNNVLLSQQEGVDAVARAMTPWKISKLWKRSGHRPRVLIMDANRRAGEGGPGPSMLAERVEGWVVGSQIDCAVVRQAEVFNIRYVSSAAGVRLLSDHRHAFRFTLRVPAYWA